MKKTNNLLSKLLVLYVEQEASEEPSQEQAPQAKQMSNNERYIVKVLTNAFIFNRHIFDTAKQNIILNKINSILKVINEPISKTVDIVKDILAMDNSLKIESKTNILLRRYLYLVEEVADGTERQPDNDEDVQSSNQDDSADDSANDNSISLEEAFPMYSDLMVRSLKHSPTDDEIMMLRSVANEFGKTDPEKIVSTIKSLLSLDEIGDI